MTKDEALKMAHKSFMQLNERYPRRDNGDGYFDKEILACKDALEQPSVAELNDQYLHDTYVEGLSQPAQEPVGWMDSEGRFRLDFKTEIVRSIAAVNKEIPLYTNPAPSWQGLSDDELSELLVSKGETSIKYLDFARAIEQALKDKNL